MTIISLLLVLMAERMTTKSQYWQFDYYFQRIVHNASDIHSHSQAKQNWWWLAIVLVPTLLVYIVVQRLSGSFVELVLSTLILMVCIGCPVVRATYECFLQAANRGDLEASMQNNLVMKRAALILLGITWCGRTISTMPLLSYGSAP